MTGADRDGLPVDLLAVHAAARAIDGIAHRTPVLRSESLDQLCNARVHLKAEHLQKTGSFKIRGATNRAAALDPDELAAGLVAVSSGNHAGAVAHTARRLGCSATIFMPHDAPAVKRRASESYGATVLTYDRATDDREAMAAAHIAEHGGTLIAPFDDPLVMAGQGTVALELHEQVELDVLVVPVSGGGLMAGCAVTTVAVRPGCRIVGVEPAGAADTRASLAAGERRRIDPDTICDGLALPTPGVRTFPVLQALVDEVVAVDDELIIEAMRLLFERTKQVVEPSGAVGVAALLDSDAYAGERVGVVLSGGNVDPSRFAALVGGSET